MAAKRVMQFLNLRCDILISIVNMVLLMLSAAQRAELRKIHAIWSRSFIHDVMDARLPAITRGMLCE